MYKQEAIDRELSRIVTPTKNDVEAIISLRLLEFHKKLVKDYGLKKTSSASKGGVIVTTRCTEDPH